MKICWHVYTADCTSPRPSQYCSVDEASQSSFSSSWDVASLGLTGLGWAGWAWCTRPMSSQIKPSPGVTSDQPVAMCASVSAHCLMQHLLTIFTCKSSSCSLTPIQKTRANLQFIFSAMLLLAELFLWYVVIVLHQIMIDFSASTSKCWIVAI